VDKQVKQRNMQRVDDTFRVMDIMEDVRDIWRESAPLQELDEQQKTKLLKKLSKAKKAIERIEATL